MATMGIRRRVAIAAATLVALFSAAWPAAAEPRMVHADDNGAPGTAFRRTAQGSRFTRSSLATKADSGEHPPAHTSKHVQADDELDQVYMVTLVGTNFGSDENAIAVRVNGVPAIDVVLHNETALSFAVPASMVLDEAIRDTSLLEVSVGNSLSLKNIPLSTVASAFIAVPEAEFRRRAMDSHGDQNSSAVDSAQSPAEQRRKNLQQQYNAVEKPEPMDTTESPDENLSDDGDKGDGGDAHSESEDVEPSIEATGNHEIPDPGDDIWSTAEDSYIPDDVQDAGDTQEESDTLEELLDDVVVALDDDSKTNHADSRQTLERAIELGSSRAMTILASLHLAGDTPGFPRDYDKAVPLLLRAVDAGYPEAQAHLGLLYASGLAAPRIPKDSGRAILMWTFAAEGGSSMAKTALAYRYHSGIDVAEDCERAASYYREVAHEIVVSGRDRASHGSSAQSGDSSGLIRPPTPRAVLMSDRKRLFENMEPRALGESNEVIQYYTHTADRGDAAAQVMIGNLYYYGATNMPQDIARARSLFERAARSGRGDAHAHLGFMELHAGNNETAVQHLLDAAMKGDKLGYHGMGYVTLHGIGVPRDEAQAAVYFAKAAEAEHPEAMFNLAIMYTRGLGVEKSAEEAFRYFQDGARFGHLSSSYNVGIKLLDGTHPARRDCSRAVQKYLKSVAQQGPWNRIFSRGLRSYEKEDYANALYRYLQAAHAGIELGQYNAAFMFEHNLVENRNKNYGSMFRSELAWSMSSLGDIEYVPTTSGEQKITGDANAEISSDVQWARRWTRKEAIQEAFGLYQMSSFQDHSPSMVRMGDLAFGEGEDFAHAMRAYERGMRMRNAEATFNLGWMHARGCGVKPDMNLAKRYFDQARDIEKDAELPARIAVFLLQYQDLILRVLDWWNAWMNQDNDSSTTTELSTKSSSGEADTSNVRHTEQPHGDAEKAWEKYGDLVILTVLLGLLGGVVNARQRRLVRGENDDGLNQEYDDTPPPEVPQEPDVLFRENIDNHDEHD